MVSICDKIPEAPLCISLYNPSEGLIADLRRVHKEKKGIDTPTVCHTRQFLIAMNDAVKNVNPNLLCLHMTHSEAGLIAKRAIEGMDPDHKVQMQERWLVRTFGSAEPLPTNYAKNVINIYSKADHITKRFAKPFLKDANYDIRLVKCISSLSERSLFIADHAMMGKTYQKSLDGSIKEDRRTYGIYNAKSR